MANILMKFNQAVSDLMSWGNLRARHAGWSDEAKGLWYKRDDGTVEGDPHFIPSTIGQGMGRRVEQASHGFGPSTLIRRAGGEWVRAQATADSSTLATHIVVRIISSDVFEIAQAGAWSFGAVVDGPVYLSGIAGEWRSTPPQAPAITQRVAIGDGVSLHLTFGGDPLNLDTLVSDLNGRTDLSAIPKGAAGGDLLGEYPNPVVQKLTGLSVTWESMAPKWADTGLPFIPTTWVLAAAYAPGTQKAMLVDNDGHIYFSETGGYTWRAAGYSVGNSIRDIAYGKISGTTYGWCVVGDYDYQWINDVPANFVGGVPLQSAWNSANLADFFTDICYCDALETWFFQSQSPGLYYGSSLPLSPTPATVTPQGADDNTGGVFYERSTGRVVYFERGTGRVWWAEAGFTSATGWTEVRLGGLPVLKAITPAMSDSNGYGAGVSTNTLVAFVGGQGVISTTSVADPTKYTQSIGAGVLPSFWDVSSNGTDLIGSTVAKVDPVLYKLFVTLGEIPSEQRIVGKKGFLSKGPLILEGMEDAEVIGTDENGVAVKKSVASLFGDLDYIGFDITPESVPVQVGAVSWNADEGTLDVQQPYGVTLQMGQELQIHVINKSGVAIPNGAPVYITGAQGNRPSVALAEADVLAHSRTIAVATMDIADNAEGFVTRVGLVRQLNTSGFAEGATLYLSDTPGVLVATPPTSRTVRVGYCVRSHATVGSIFVACEGTPNLDDLGDVDAASPTEGYYLKYVSGRWVPAAVSGGGGGSLTLKYASTMKAGSQTGNVGLNSGDSTQWAAHGTIMVPEGDVVLTQNASKFAVICPQPVNNASYILAVYAWPDTGTTMTLVAQTAVNVMPGSSSWLEAVMTSSTVTLIGGKRYFFVILWNGNGATLAGTTGANLNVQPYIAFRKNNMGVLTTAPATLTAEGELPQHFFGRVAS